MAFLNENHIAQNEAMMMAMVMMALLMMTMMTMMMMMMISINGRRSGGQSVKAMLSNHKTQHGVS